MNRIGEPTLLEVIEGAAEAFGVSPDDLTSRCRCRPIPQYRNVTMAACRELTSRSLITIGAAFGRHHTTVLDACTRVEVDAQSSALLVDLLSALSGSVTIREVESASTNGGRGDARTPPGRGRSLPRGSSDG